MNTLAGASRLHLSDLLIGTLRKSWEIPYDDGFYCTAG